MFKNDIQTMKTFFLLLSVFFLSETTFSQQKPDPNAPQKSENQQRIENISSQKISLPDSTVFKIMDRKVKEWKNSLVVIDWTGSMYEHGSQVLLLMNLYAEQKENIQKIALFNDGDDKKMGEKVLGSAGGIYVSESNHPREILRLMKKAEKGGQGGYDSENDMEALLVSMQSCPTCENIILIADATSQVRDLPLLQHLKQYLKQNKKKLHIILCGTNTKMQADYIEIAWQTGATLHTIEQDIESLNILEEGEEVKIVRWNFRKHQGSLEYIPPKNTKSKKKKKRR